ncbi:DEAD/DEAH box helicase [Clostridia bacterium]|nr:DEAD/DEAH box helicase [Clostridia bacterium]
MTNFEFLKSKTEFAAFADACVEAETSVAVSPALCALACRKSVELAVKWLYSADSSLTLPFNDNLSALIYNPTFTDVVDADIVNKLKYIVKLGNLAAHTGKGIKRNEAVVSLSNLFDFIGFIDYCYGTTYEERSFSESVLPAEKAVSTAEVDRLKSELDNKSTESEKLIEQVKSLSAEMEQLKARNTEARTFSQKPINEDETRKTLIDVDLKAAGWVFGKNCLEEVAVVGMPISSHNPNGNGRVDYVLYGDNGKPLAIVEAKRTSRSAKEGKQQAKQYADCLERMTGQRPLIFYTNGYETWFWDDFDYPERQVYSVFAKEDMERIIGRRDSRREFGQLGIDEMITNRDYQKIAIQRVCKDFSDKRRKALLVMATGTGKTRVAASIVDVLSRHRWVTNVLFLADRVELVSQAKDAFNKSLPNLTTCNLLKYMGNEKPTDRAVFSTYPTIMNAIDKMRTEDGKKLFTPAHFDLIIVDEAHRSIFRKYRAIFEYFDALVIGLTATPKTEVDRNTYDFFEMENNMPTYAYEYDTAVAEEFLSDYHCIEKTYKIPMEGILKKELTQEEQLALDDVFESEEETPDFISGEEVNRVFFNVDTCRRVIQDLMKMGLKVEGGDRLGKTIIFARNHKHAEFIEQQFNILYPQYKGNFARVIDYKSDGRAEDLLKNFKKKDSDPQIAISVDMLDTGIDVPEILNLVFFKRVLSKTKFWQMFGRGTRLCEDLFGEGEDKTCFYVFDYLQNIEYFKQKPQGIESSDTGSLAERAFIYKCRIVQGLQDVKWSDAEAFRAELVDELSLQVSELIQERFDVKQQLRYVEKFSVKDAFQCLTATDVEELVKRLANLVPAIGDDEAARRFDILMYQYMFAVVSADEGKMRSVSNRIIGIASALETKKATLNDVKKNAELLARVQQAEFWEKATFPQLDEVRAVIRELMYCLKTEMRTKVINVTDAVLFEKEGTRFTGDPNLESYYRRAAKYVEENSDKPALKKLRANEHLTDADWSELEQIFWHEVGTKTEYDKEANGFTLGRFVRTLTGLDEEALKTAFSDFLDTGSYTESQIQMVKYIIDGLKEYGTLQKEEMSADFFGGLQVFEVWGEESHLAKWRNLQSIIYAINNNAERMAA